MAEPDPAPGRQGERRLPMALAVVAAAGLYLLIPADFRIAQASRIGYPALLLLLLDCWSWVTRAGSTGSVDGCA